MVTGERYRSVRLKGQMGGTGEHVNKRPEEGRTRKPKMDTGRK